MTGSSLDHGERAKPDSEALVGHVAARSRPLAESVPTTLRATSFAHGGACIAKQPGQPVVFIAGAVPGDLVRVEVTRTGRGLAQARIVEILEAGPGRRPPPCPEAGACGGCDWQHVDDDRQAEAARQLLAEGLDRLGVEASSVVTPPRALESRLAYRQRARLHLDLRGSPPRLGYFAARSHEVHPATACAVLEPELDAIRAAVAAAIPDLAALVPWASSGELQLDLPAPGAGLARLSLDVDDDAATPAVARAAVRAALGRACRLLREAAPTLEAIEAVAAARPRRRRAGPPSRARVVARARCGPAAIPYRRGTIEQPERWLAWLSPGGFMQASREGNLLLTSRVLAAAAGHAAPGTETLELFCGNGNFTVPLAAGGARVTAVESDVAAAENARRAVEDAGLVADVRALDAAAAVATLVAEHQRFDLVVLDPPRTGARTCCELLPPLEARAIVYASCDTATFLRDTRSLLDGGYRLARAEPLLLFPQTSHFEIVALFERT